MAAIQMGITVRQATVEDLPLILGFIGKKAEFDRSLGAFTGKQQTTAANLRKTLFNDAPFAKVLFAEAAGNPVGFALYYFRYSSFAARPSLWLDDLYVDAEIRGQGAGTALMKQLAEIAISQHCTHIGWTAHANNFPGVAFYKKLGAVVIEQKQQTLFFHLRLESLAVSSRGYC